MAKYNYQGLLITIYGVAVSLALGVVATPFTPDFSKTVCNVSTPVAEFQDELQWAKSIDANEKCVNNAKTNQFFIVSYLIFLAYIQMLRCLILASYLFSKYEAKKNEEKFYAIENAEQMYSGLLEEQFKAKKPMFDDLESMKASYIAQKIAVDGFCASIENRSRYNSSICDQPDTKSK
jgi:hypothetical protein